MALEGALQQLKYDSEVAADAVTGVCSVPLADGSSPDLTFKVRSTGSPYESGETDSEVHRLWEDCQRKRSELSDLETLDEMKLAVLQGSSFTETLESLARCDGAAAVVGGSVLIDGSLGSAVTWASRSVMLWQLADGGFTLKERTRLHRSSGTDEWLHEEPRSARPPEATVHGALRSLLRLSDVERKREIQRQRSALQLLEQMIDLQQRPRHPDGDASLAAAGGGGGAEPPPPARQCPTAHVRATSADGQLQFTRLVVPDASSTARHTIVLPAYLPSGASRWAVLPGHSRGIVAAAQEATRECAPSTVEAVRLFTVDVPLNGLLLALPPGGAIPPPTHSSTQLPTPNQLLASRASAGAPSATLSQSIQPNEQPTVKVTGLSSAQNKWAEQYKQEHAARTDSHPDPQQRQKELVELMEAHPSLKEELLAVNRKSISHSEKQKEVDTLVNSYRKLGVRGA